MKIEISHVLAIDGYCICSRSPISCITDGPCAVGLGFSTVSSKHSLYIYIHTYNIIIINTLTCMYMWVSINKK